MKITRYVGGDHFFSLIYWLRARNAYISPPEEMPKLGYVASLDDHQHVAMGFLRYVEGGFMQLDGLTTNPEALSIHRHEGIDLVVAALLKNAQDLGIKSVLAMSTDIGTLERSKKHGFVVLPHTLISVTLKP